MSEVKTTVTGAPNNIYLNFFIEEEGEFRFAELVEVTWSESRKTRHDIKYVKSTPDTPAPLTYTPAQVIEMVECMRRKDWKPSMTGWYQNKNMGKIYSSSEVFQQLLTTLGLSVPGDKM